MTVWLYTLTSVIIVSVISFAGIITLLPDKKKLNELLLYAVSFAVGALYGDAFIHLIPETFEKQGISLAASLYILAGIFIFFIVEKFIRWSQNRVFASSTPLHPMVPMILIVDTVHNLIDGMVIGAGYIVSIPIGIATTLGVVFHEIPHEVSDFAVLVKGGFSVKKALIFNFLSALAAVLGGVISLVIGGYALDYSSIVLPITAGGFIYIAGSDLIPELQREIRWRSSAGQIVMALLGIGIMVLLLMAG